jgi:hypothetical protein
VGNRSTFFDPWDGMGLTKISHGFSGWEMVGPPSHGSTSSTLYTKEPWSVFRNVKKIDQMSSSWEQVKHHAPFACSLAAARYLVQFPIRRCYHVLGFILRLDYCHLQRNSVEKGPSRSHNLYIWLMIRIYVDPIRHCRWLAPHALAATKLSM